VNTIKYKMKKASVVLFSTLAIIPVIVIGDSTGVISNVNKVSALVGVEEDNLKVGSYNVSCNKDSIKTKDICENNSLNNEILKVVSTNTYDYKEIDLSETFEIGKINNKNKTYLATINAVEINTVTAIQEVIASPVIEEVKSSTGIDVSKPLLNAEVVDSEYRGAQISLSAGDRDLLERLVMGETNGQGLEGAALVAQCIRDTILDRGYNSIDALRKGMRYAGSVDTEPNQEVLDAVSFIFDDGGMAVQHKLMYFYAFKKCGGGFHETQQFVIEYKDHRFFSTWN
jgi:hypothetical protein